MFIIIVLLTLIITIIVIINYRRRRQRGQDGLQDRDGLLGGRLGTQHYACACV